MSKSESSDTIILMPFAIAQESANLTQDQTIEDDLTDNSSVELNENTKLEVEHMNTPFGAQVRLLQLQKSVAANIVVGNEVINTILAKDNLTENQSATLNSLKSIVAELTALNLQIQSVNTTNSNSSVDLVKQFVDFKNDANTLSKNFRDRARTLLAPGELAKIKETVQEKVKNSDEVKALKAQIELQAREYNSQMVEKYLIEIGTTNEDLVAKVKSGEISVQDAIKQLKNSFNNLSKDKKKEFVQQMKEDVAKNQVFQKELVQKMKIKNLNEEQKRFDDRLSKIQDQKQKVLAQQRHDVEKAKMNFEKQKNELKDLKDRMQGNGKNNSNKTESWNGDKKDNSNQPELGNGNSRRND